MALNNDASVFQVSKASVVSKEEVEHYALNRDAKEEARYITLSYLTFHLHNFDFIFTFDAI
jgi:pectate lyase